MLYFRKTLLLLLLWGLTYSGIIACSNADSDCPLPPPFCGGDFVLNTEMTTPYGPAWADISAPPSGWATCYGPYALCYYAQCEPSAENGNTVADCPCYEWFGTNHVLINAILSLDLYQETLAFCTENPDLCNQPNQAPICEAINNGTYMEGAALVSTFSFYRSAQEPIGSTDCTSDPGLYAGCMTSPCFGESFPGPDNTTMIQCDCPTYDGPFQATKSNISCDISPLVYSAAYNPYPPPSSPCDMVNGCIPDAPEDECGCGLYQPGVTTLPPDSGVDCAEVCNEYDSCTNSNDVQLGYTCDATLCTSDEGALVFEACMGLQNCDLSEIFKAETAAQCSCCASQLCNCSANAITNQKIGELNTQQRNDGETPQCDINGTLCGS